MATKIASEMSDEELGEKMSKLWYGARDYATAAASIRSLFAPHPHSPAVDDELVQVRADITRVQGTVLAISTALLPDAEGSAFPSSDPIFKEGNANGK